MYCKGRVWEVVFIAYIFVAVSRTDAWSSLWCTYMTNQQMNFYKYVQSRVIVLQQRISVTPVAIISVSYNKNTINVK
jgi:hypothetical protein